MPHPTPLSVNGKTVVFGIGRHELAAEGMVTFNISGRHFGSDVVGQKVINPDIQHVIFRTDHTVNLQPACAKLAVYQLVEPKTQAVRAAGQPEKAGPSCWSFPCVPRSLDSPSWHSGGEGMMFARLTFLQGSPDRLMREFGSRRRFHRTQRERLGSAAERGPSIGRGQSYRGHSVGERASDARQRGVGAAGPSRSPSPGSRPRWFRDRSLGHILARRNG
jgi:hypothetical protein